MIQFEIIGDPVPQKQTRFSRGRAYDPSHNDLKRIQWQAKVFAPTEPLKGLIDLNVTFFLPIPKNTSSIKRRQMINGRIRPDVKPDGSNLYYLLENALKKIIYDDDARIVRGSFEKYYSENPRTVVRVRTIEEAIGHKGEK